MTGNLGGIALLRAGQAGEGFGGAAAGGGLVLALLYWKIVLSLLLVVGIEAELITRAQALRRARLRGIAKAALRRSAGDVCRIDERFALDEAIDSEATAHQARLLRHIAPSQPRPDDQRFLS